MSNIVKEYDALLDRKNRITIRGGSTFSNFHVSMYSDGKIVLEPRYLAKPDELSKKTLEMIESSANNLAKGIAGKPIDLSKLKDISNE